MHPSERIQKAWLMCSTAWASNSDGERIRRLSHPNCFKLMKNGTVLDHHFSRTELSYVKREDDVEEAKRRFETTKQRTIGKFRNQLEIRRNVSSGDFPSDRNRIGGSSNTVQQKGDVEYIELRIPTIERLTTSVNRMAINDSGSRGSGA